MSEGFELVRTVRQHLRRSAALLDEGKFDDALAEADSALVLDPQSLPAQALRDRILNAKSGAAAPAHVTGSAALPGAFVPHGVNAASWRGFEQRITERRFKALLDTIHASIVAGDGAAAQAALEEARELRPDAPILGDFAARIAAIPVVASSAAGKANSRRIWMRAMGAAALLLVGVSLLLGIEWMRPGDQTTSAPPAAPVAAPSVPAVTPTQDANPAPSPDLGPVPVALNDEEVPAIVTPPEPLLRPTATTGTTTGATAAPPPPAVPTPSIPVASARPTSIDGVPERTVAEDEQPSGARGEVSDEFVASRRPAAALTTDAGPAVAPMSMPRGDTPVTADARGNDATSAVAPAAVSIPAGVDQHGRVEEVLQRYARAYSQLDASGARAVWPTVDERALSRAFQNLSSQRVSLDNCDIDIRGVVANASCRGQASFAPKVGNREQRTEERSWRFELRRDGDVWQIVDVDARRQSTLDYR